MASNPASKGRKKQPRKQCFKSDYSAKWDFIVKSSKGASSARCTVCRSDFSIAHSGAYDIEHHIKTVRHETCFEDLKKQPSILQCFSKPPSACFDVIRAETLWTEYIVEHNMPFSASDDFTTVVKKMFPDSKIAAQFSCRRTKTTAIARTLGHDTQGHIVKKLRETRFSLSTDGSADRGADEQLYPVVVRYYDEDVHRVVGVLLTIATTEERSTGVNIYKLLENVLNERKISWSNCVCFSADNASVMMGVHAGVAAYVRKANPDVFVLGCPCHRLHLAAEKGASTLPFSPADLLTSIYYYLEKSSKRHKELKGVQKLCGTATHKILKHVCTRWLSLESALGRLLEQWDALVIYFGQEAGVLSEKRKQDDDVQASVQPKKVREDATSSGSTGKSKPSKPKENPEQRKLQTLSSDTTTPASTMEQKNDGQASSQIKKLKAVTKSSALAGKSNPSKQTVSFERKSSSSSSVISKICAGSSTSPSTRHLKPVSKVKETAAKPKKAVSTSCSNSGKKGNQKPSTAKTVKPTSSPTKKAKEIHSTLTVYNKLYCLFLKHTLPLFTNLNLELQKDVPMVHLLDDKLNKLLKDVLVRFVKPVVLKTSTDLKKCPYKVEANQRSNEDLVIGHDVRHFIESHTLSSNELDEFFSSVRTYFTTISDYILSTFPLRDDFLKHAAVANYKNRLHASFCSVRFFAERFHMTEELDQLESEFASFQLDDLDTIDMDRRVEEVWFAISQLKDDGNGQYKYVHLSKLMLVVLSVSHSNAEDERIFSIVRKNATEFRSSLSTAVLSDTLVNKIYWQAAGLPSYKRELSTDLLQKCKKATMEQVKGDASGSKEDM